MQNQWRPKVKVVPKKSSGYWVFRWRDRAGKWKEKQSLIPASRPKLLAQRAALQFEETLLSQATVQRLTWSEACELYESGRLAERSAGTRENWASIRRMVEEVLKPSFVFELDSLAVDSFAAKMLGNGNSSATVAGKLAYLKAFLRWCN